MRGLLRVVAFLALLAPLGAKDECCCPDLTSGQGWVVQEWDAPGSTTLTPVGTVTVVDDHPNSHIHFRFTPIGGGPSSDIFAVYSGSPCLFHWFDITTGSSGRIWCDWMGGPPCRWLWSTFGGGPGGTFVSL